MGKRESSGHSLVVAGQSFRVTHETVPISSVRLDPNNGRIRFQLQRTNTRPTQEQLLKFIREQPAFPGLQRSIRKAGGLHDPVLIRHDGRVVEGNSRITVLTILHEGNRSDSRWKQIPVIRLPKDVPERAIALLTAAYHVAGKTKWPAFAKGDQIYRLVKDLGYTAEQVADDLRNMTTKEVEQHIEAYEYLVNEVMPHAEKGSGEEFLEDKWSHALEFVSSRKLGDMRKDPQVRKTVAKLLVKDQIKGAEVRQLPKILKHKRALRVLKKEGFSPAKDVLRKVDPTIDNSELRQIKKLTEKIKEMTREDWEIFMTDSKAQKILTDHAKAVQNLLAITKIKVSSRG